MDWSLGDTNHLMSRLYKKVKGLGVIEACDFYFGAKKDVQKSNVPSTNEYGGHPSIAKLISEDYKIIKL